jgi:hypothetical protein
LAASSSHPWEEHLPRLCQVPQAQPALADPWEPIRLLFPSVRPFQARQPLLLLPFALLEKEELRRSS